MDKILIAAPNHEIKEYSFQRWIDSVLKIDYSNLEFLVVDNSATLDFYNRWADKLKEKNIKFINIKDEIYAGRKISELGPNQRIASSFEYIRQYFINGDFVRWFLIESDVICPPEILKYFLSLPQFDWIGHCYPQRGVPSNYMSSFGTSLFSRNIMQVDFNGAPEETTTDGWWYNVKGVKNMKFSYCELWHIFELGHLEN